MGMVHFQDPFYESDEYRKAGGNGTSYWIYNVVSLGCEQKNRRSFVNATHKFCDIQQGLVCNITKY